ncbi:MAG: hypothetical protein KatS3mg084_0391 [Candidatus Dojkabacteria bacterium]|nr:MAG: hypothetical protein KatS3mg084_0391 [Candidatus Dojkabacteria bacterium]
MDNTNQKPNNISSLSMQSYQAGGLEPSTVLLNPTTATKLTDTTESKFKKFIVIAAALIVELIVPMLCVLLACAVSILYRLI